MERATFDRLVLKGLLCAKGSFRLFQQEAAMTLTTVTCATALACRTMYIVRGKLKVLQQQ